MNGVRSLTDKIVGLSKNEYSVQVVFDMQQQTDHCTDTCTPIRYIDKGVQLRLTYFANAGG